MTYLTFVLVANVISYFLLSIVTCLQRNVNRLKIILPVTSVLT
jgi:hypothetical protein